MFANSPQSLIILHHQEQGEAQSGRQLDCVTSILDAFTFDEYLRRSIESRQLILTGIFL
jgi:hypothetical protein